MFFPNTTCRLIKEGALDQYGQRTRGTETTEECAVVKLEVAAKKTSVRADSSASRGKAQEQVSDARLLFRPNVGVDIGDFIEIMGYTLRVSSVHPRRNVMGDLDHYQVDADAWA